MLYELSPGSRAFAGAGWIRCSDDEKWFWRTRVVYPFFAQTEQGTYGALVATDGCGSEIGEYQQTGNHGHSLAWIDEYRRGGEPSVALPRCLSAPVGVANPRVLPSRHAAGPLNTSHDAREHAI
jgi:hypothetical protein